MRVSCECEERGARRTPIYDMLWERASASPSGAAATAERCGADCQCDGCPYLTPSRRNVLKSLHNSPRRATSSKISRVFQERTWFSMEDKENRPDNFYDHRTGHNRRKLVQTNLLHTETDLFQSEVTHTNEFFQSRMETHRSETKTSETRNESFFRSDSSFFRSQLSGNEGLLSRTQGAQFKTDGLVSRPDSLLSRTDSLISRNNDVLTRIENSMDSVFGEESASCQSGASPAARSRELSRVAPAATWTRTKVLGSSPLLQTPARQEECSRDSGHARSAPRPASPLLHDEQTMDVGHLLRGTPDYTLDIDKPCTSKSSHHVPESDAADIDHDLETLHDLEEEFDSDNFDKCTKYEIISTDSPNIISRGSSTRKITSKNFVFGAPIADTERSTSFNMFRAHAPNPAATRMLNFDDAEPSFEFTSPASIRPRSGHGVSVKKALQFTESPARLPLGREWSGSSIGSASNTSPVSHKSDDKTRLRLFNSESTTSMESGFVSEIEDTFLFDSIDPDNSTSSPKVANFCELISGQIKDTTLLPVSEESMELEADGTPGRPALYRSVSLNPDLDKVRISLFRSSLSSPSEAMRPFKRPEPPATLGALEEEGSKRRKSNCEAVMRAARPVLQRALSENAACIMSALARSESDPELTGDFSRACALPLTRGTHTDLRCITADTLAALLRGDYGSAVRHYQVIDCRYPYEFAGGHVRGARNLHTRDQVLSLLDGGAEDEEGVGTGAAGRHILVFHCEFSLERGPKLCRLLRSRDRARNRDAYPALRHPELYLLHEGYAAFHRRHPALCEPAGYTPMLHPRHRAELASCRAAADASNTTDEDARRALQRTKSRSRLLL